MTTVEKWEYMVQRIVCDDPKLEKGFDKLGEDGWELTTSTEMPVSFSSSTKVVIFFFKRPKRAIPETDKPRDPDPKGKKILE